MEKKKWAFEESKIEEHHFVEVAFRNPKDLDIRMLHLKRILNHPRSSLLFLLTMT